VNNNHLANSNVAATFDLNAKVPGSDLNYFGIDRGRNYNVKDLLADNATAYVWATNRTGADLIDNGLFVGLPNTNAATGSYQAQYLQLVDVSAPTLSFVPAQFMTYGTTNTLTASVTPASPVAFSLVGGDTNKVSLSGNQLVINSGAGSVVVRAAVAATADRGGTTADATITFTKTSQTITFSPSSLNANVGDPDRLLLATSRSGETVTFTSSNPDVASVNGSTLTFRAAGSTTITANAAGNDNFLPADPFSLTFTVTGTSFAGEWVGQTATSDANGDGVPALAEYALGGIAGSNNIGVLPQLTRSNNTLTLSALVRINDPKLSVFPQSASTLGTNSWSSGGFTTNISTNGVPSGFERRTYTYDAGTNARAFLRLFITNSP
jgi:plastocyanin